ncbi:MAG TPA: hypothetical protein VKE24_08250 [Candidatus Acidoferrales bacterium]|nr:hypothetical protein [Candidatus Acidoferrales bacterium]
MIWLLTIIAFLGTAILVALAFFAFSTSHQIREFLKRDLQARAKGSERRRSNRLRPPVPVIVFGYRTDGAFFHEDTMTQQGNAHGGLLCLAASVKTGQSLWLTNKLTQKQEECHVVRVGSSRREKTDVGFEFAQPAPEFWRAQS